MCYRALWGEGIAGDVSDAKATQAMEHCRDESE